MTKRSRPVVRGYRRAVPRAVVTPVLVHPITLRVNRVAAVTLQVTRQAAYTLPVQRQFSVTLVTD